MSHLRGGRVVAIVNPAAGNGTGERIARRLGTELAAAGVRAEIVRSPDVGEAARLARQAAAEGCAAVVAVGGDGTANETANGLVGSSTALALYPIGSGNDFARALGYPRRRRDLARFIAAAHPRIIDVGEANGRVFVNVAGVGIDGHVAERVVASTRVVGPGLGYLVGALVSIAAYRPQPMRVRVDDVTREGRHLVVVASNGTHFGGGMHVAPRAALDDGLLDVVVAGDLDRWSTLVALGKLYRGTHVDGRTIVAFRARSLEVELDRPTPMELDGEGMRVTALAVRVRPAALTVLVA